MMHHAEAVVPIPLIRYSRSCLQSAQLCLIRFQAGLPEAFVRYCELPTGPQSRHPHQQFKAQDGVLETMKDLADRIPAQLLFLGLVDLFCVFVNILFFL
jgi:hypothetical protein